MTRGPALFEFIEKKRQLAPNVHLQPFALRFSLTAPFCQYLSRVLFACSGAAIASSELFVLKDACDSVGWNAGPRSADSCR